MDIKQALVLTAALAAAQPPAAFLHYDSRCGLNGTSVDGYVTNLSQDAYQVSGAVRFIFVRSNSMSRPGITATADSLIPPGQTVRVASVQLAFQPDYGDTCRFDVAGAVRKQ
jgi:hypothetical protein